MSEFRSKVTLRPRSKLERILDFVSKARGVDPTPPPTPEYQQRRVRKQSEVAPSEVALRVAARLGYPGNEPAAIARALDAEVPEGDPTAVAWRAHYHLHIIGERWCHAERTDCGACPARSVCDYGGLGLDPALRLVAPPTV